MTKDTDYSNLIQKGEYESTNMILNSELPNINYTMVGSIEINDEDDIINILVEVRELKGLKQSIVVKGDSDKIYNIMIPKDDYEKLNKDRINNNISKISGIKRFLMYYDNRIIILLLFLILFSIMFLFIPNSKKILKPS
jgi:hypothetical protein